MPSNATVKSVVRIKDFAEKGEPVGHPFRGNQWTMMRGSRVASDIERHTVAAKEMYPRLAEFLGDKLIVESSLDHEVVKIHLRDLNQLPDSVLKFVKDNNVEICISNEVYTRTNDNSNLVGVIPRGWSIPYTWDTVAGGYDSIDNRVCAGNGLSGSHSLILHEVGHAIYGNSLRSKNIAMLKEFYVAQLSITDDKLIPYFRQAAGIGTQELIAETFGYMYRDYRYYGHITSKASLAIRTSQMWADTFDKYITEYIK